MESFLTREAWPDTCTVVGTCIHVFCLCVCAAAISVISRFHKRFLSLCKREWACADRALSKYKSPKYLCKTSNKNAKPESGSTFPHLANKIEHLVQKIGPPEKHWKHAKQLSQNLQRPKIPKNHNFFYIMHVYFYSPFVLDIFCIITKASRRARRSFTLRTKWELLSFPPLSGKFHILIFYSLFAMISFSIAHFHFLVDVQRNHICNQLRLVQLRAKHKSFHHEAWLLADLGAQQHCH